MAVTSQALSRCEVLSTSSSFPDYDDDDDDDDDYSVCTFVLNPSRSRSISTAVVVVLPFADLAHRCPALLLLPFVMFICSIVPPPSDRVGLGLGLGRGVLIDSARTLYPGVSSTVNSCTWVSGRNAFGMIFFIFYPFGVLHPSRGGEREVRWWGDLLNRAIFPEQRTSERLRPCMCVPGLHGCLTTDGYRRILLLSVIRHAHARYRCFHVAPRRCWVWGGRVRVYFQLQQYYSSIVAVEAVVLIVVLIAVVVV